MEGSIMHKSTATSTNRTRHNGHAFATDLRRIKNALADATFTVKNSTGDMLAKSYKDVKNRSEEMQENVSIYIADKPFKSVGIALLAGMFIGLWLRK